MFEFNIFRLVYDVIIYMVAVRSLIDEILYKLRFKRHLNVNEDLPVNLSRQVAIVTGGTRGLGLTVVRTLLAKGCFVFVASSQTEEKFPNLIKKICHELPERDPNTGIKRGVVSLQHLDLSSMDSVKSFIAAFKECRLKLNYLICNAGIMFAPRQVTQDRFESHLAINYLGHSLLIMELLSDLKKTADETNSSTRIVSVSSSTHRATRFRFEDLLCEYEYSSSQAYSQSKLAQIMFSSKLSQYMRQSLKWNNVQTFTLHPGVVISELYEHVSIIKYFPFLVPLIKLFTRNMIQGAETTLYATLSDELRGVSGVYLEDCAIKEPSRRARREVDCDHLWELTRDLLSPWLSDDTKKLLKC